MAIRPAISGTNFDSVFERAQAGRAARLVIKLKVTLIPLDPRTAWARTKHGSTAPGTPAGPLPPSRLAPDNGPAETGNVVDVNGTAFACRSWRVSEWPAFTKRFKSIVETAWNNQMIFLPVELGGAGGTLEDAELRAMIGNPRMPAHVQGAIEIELQPPGTAGHAVIEVAHVATPGQPFRHRMTRITDESVVFGTNTFTQGASRGVTGEAGQFAAAHEVGHWLRSTTETVYSHIDRAEAVAKGLTGAQLDDGQYGLALSRFQSMMGGGTLVSSHEARPWIGRLGDHTSLKLGWLFVHRVKFRWNPDEVSSHQRRLLLTDRFLPRILTG